jgi:hypothetical protein
MRAAHDAKNLRTAIPQCQRSVGHFRFRLFRLFRAIAASLSTFGALQLSLRLRPIATRYAA